MTTTDEIQEDESSNGLQRFLKELGPGDHRLYGAGRNILHGSEVDLIQTGAHLEGIRDALLVGLRR